MKTTATMSTLLAAIAICAPTPAQAKLRVVATLPSLAALVRAVGGDLVHVTALALPDQDPHYVDPRPSLMLPLNQADLLVINGLDLEVGWLPPVQTGARNPAILVGGPGFFDASAHVSKLGGGQGKVDRRQGDVHAGGNPHFTLDPRRGRQVAAALAKRLAAIDPDHAADYQRRFLGFAAAIDEIIEGERARFAKLPAQTRRLVVYHRSLDYLEDWLGLHEVAAVEPLPGIPPNPGHVAAVLETMRASNARIIIQEEFYQQGTSKTLAKLAKGEVVVIPGGAHFARGEGYVEHMRHIAAALYEAITRTAGEVSRR